MILDQITIHYVQIEKKLMNGFEQNKYKFEQQIIKQILIVEKNQQLDKQKDGYHKFHYNQDISVILDIDFEKIYSIVKMNGFHLMNKKLMNFMIKQYTIPTHIKLVKIAI